ncbi:hypothetical protein PIB30_014767 [Stylosanthes scabra]|uniref:Uncharacterized protein n=1 Tax=Stylosanthes scabra TaxID=79078 RepID=A0ABU6Y739_9FABA|nr:hypothetical protein [Stylosanthes scabra]
MTVVWPIRSKRILQAKYIFCTLALSVGTPYFDSQWQTKMKRVCRTLITQVTTNDKNNRLTSNKRSWTSTLRPTTLLRPMKPTPGRRMSRLHRYPPLRGKGVGQLAPSTGSLQAGIILDLSEGSEARNLGLPKSYDIECSRWNRRSRTYKRKMPNLGMERVGHEVGPHPGNVVAQGLAHHPDENPSHCRSHIVAVVVRRKSSPLRTTRGIEGIGFTDDTREPERNFEKTLRQSQDIPPSRVELSKSSHPRVS